MAGRTSFRCPNRDCPSASPGGRVLFDVLAGSIIDFRTKSHGALTLLGIVLTATCPSCNQTWINPEVQLFDGVAAVVQRAVEDAAEQLRQAAEHTTPIQRRRRRADLTPPNDLCHIH